MYLIALAAAGGFLILLYLARGEDPGQEGPVFLKPFLKVSLHLYKKLCPRFPGLFSSSQVEKDLSGLHPGEPPEYLTTQYYVRKAALSMGIVLAGTLFGAAARYSAESEVLLGEDGTIPRGDIRDGVREIVLAAEYGKRQIDFRLQVEPQQLSPEETEALFDSLLEELPEYIRGENSSLQEVRTDLVLQERYGTFPVIWEWESSRPDLVGSSGYVMPVEQAQEVVLSVSLSYGDHTRNSQLKVTLLPPVYSEEELLYLELLRLLDRTQKESRGEETWQLPLGLQGEEIRWKQVVEDNSLLLWAGALGAAIAAYLFTDRDLHEKLEKRRKSLHREYPEIVHKLALFVGAGMTTRGAFQKIAGDYEAKLAAGGRASPAYEEMLYTCRELRSGVSEGRSYEHFGRRTGLQEYVRLSTLLMQNLKRGNSALLERLREEADKAWEEQLQQGRRMGEEAGTKLLVPMVMMLAVVMVMIMVPAFSAI